jgi:hypothetical protein
MQMQHIQRLMGRHGEFDQLILVGRDDGYSESHENVMRAGRLRALYD